jgi:hypothetical protein
MDSAGMNNTPKLSRKRAPDMAHNPYRWRMGNAECAAESKNGGIFTDYLP